MDSDNRGVIHSRDRSRQINDFRNMRYFRNITPTDIDGALEINDDIYIFFEIKYRDKNIDDGQRWFFERVCNVINNYKNCICIHGRHDVDNWEDDVDVSLCEVVKYYSKSSKWIIPVKKMSLYELTKEFILQYGKKEYLGDNN